MLLCCQLISQNYKKNFENKPIWILLKKLRKAQVFTTPYDIKAQTHFFHGNSVSITWKHQKCIFSFAKSSLKNQRIKWWKQKLKTNPNILFSHRTHQFWVMGDENGVMGNRKQQIQTASYWWQEGGGALVIKSESLVLPSAI